MNLSAFEQVEFPVNDKSISVYGTHFYGIASIGDLDGSVISERVKLYNFLGNGYYYTAIDKNITDLELELLGVKVYRLLPLWKLDPFLGDSLRKDKNQRIKLLINIVGNWKEEFTEPIEELCENSVAYNSLSNSLEIVISKENIDALLKMPFISWLELATPSLETNNLRERTNHRVPAIEHYKGFYNLNGKGVVVGEWDGGGAGPHVDYNFRMTRLDTFINNSNGRHATHVAGTVLGAGIINPDAKGMAPEAKLISYSFYGNIPAKMDSAARIYGIELTQNSYSYGRSSDPCSRRGTYDNISVALDRLVVKYPDLLHVFAAGNSRSSNCLSGGYGTVHSGFQASKNAMAVGAINYLNGNSWFHSYGPLKDGRLKPEICAVGVSVYSTFPYDNYRGGYSGTSMACPGTSGTAALIMQLYKEKFNISPPAHLIKGVLCNGADEIGRSGPDFQYGFGRLNALRAADIIEENTFVIDSVSNGASYSDTIFINGNHHEFKVMMCYDDKPGTSSTSIALVNDLDLSLEDSAGNTVQPWVLDPSSPTSIATHGTDTLNNIEQITISQPTSPYYIFTVSGTAIPSGKQKFSVNWLFQDTALAITYPNGGENWVPPSTSSALQTIRWESNGLTGKGTLAYSIDSGASWLTISSNVTLSRGYYNWSNCPNTVKTANALVKISQGIYVDSSNAVFSIFSKGPTASAVACSGQLHISWNGVSGATSYKVFMNDSGKVKLMGQTDQLSMTLRGLDNSTSYWVSISALDSHGAEGPRSIAKKFQPNAAVLTPTFSAGPGDTTICSGASIAISTVVSGTLPITMLWQQSIDNGSSWQDISGATSSTLNTSSLFTKDHNTAYRLYAKNSCNSDEVSLTAIVKVDSILPFTYAQDSIELCLGQDTVLKLNQSGNNTNLAHWYYEDNVGGIAVKLTDSSSVSYSMLHVEEIDEGMYYASLINTCGIQSNSDRINLIVRDALSLVIEGDDTICNGQEAVVTALAYGGDTTSYSYFWSFDTISIEGSVLQRKTDSTEIWTCGVFDDCSKDTVYIQHEVVVRSIPSVRLSNDTTICKGTSAEIWALGSGGNSSSYHYLWNNGLSDTNAATVSPLISTSYGLIFTDSCSSKINLGSVLISVRDELEVTILSDRDSLCHKENYTLGIETTGGLSNGYTATWTDGSIGDSLDINPDSTTAYFVELRDGCTILPAYDTIVIPVRAPLELSIVGLDTLCLGEVALYAGLAKGGLRSSYIYTWSDDTSTNDVAIKGAADTVIRVLLSDGCTPQSIQASKSIVVRERLAISTAINPITACNGELIDIVISTRGGNGHYDIMWSNGMTNVKKWTTRLYDTTQLSIHLLDNCTAHGDTLGLVVNVRPPLVLDAGDDIYTCEDYSEEVELSGAGGHSDTYVFSNQFGVLKGNSYTKDFKQSEKLFFQLSDGCSESDAFDTVAVFINQIFAPIRILQQENLSVSVTTFVDEYDHFWGKELSDLNLNNDSIVTLKYQNFGIKNICLRKVDDIGCVKEVCQEVNVFDVFTTESFEVIVFPNPMDDFIEIRLNKVAGILKIRMIDMLGEVVWDDSYSTYDKTSYRFSTSSLSSGMYTLEVNANEEILFFKIIKTRDK